LFELRPIILESRGLIPALHAYYRQLESSLNCKIHLDTRPLGFDMSLQGGSSIFSIIQEAVNNIRKHAQATNIWIRVFADPEFVHFEIEDDGIGFAVVEGDSEEAEQISFGLRNMHERARMLSGELTVTSPRTTGNGTLVKGLAPVKRLLATKDE
jgi:signal transduction histidine kinase